MEPHDWNDRDWRTQCGSVEGIADSCPINYKEILGDLQTSEHAKDKELMAILDSIKQKSVLFGDAEDPFRMTEDEMSLLLPDVLLDSDEKRAMISILGSKSDGSNNSDGGMFGSTSKSDSDETCKKVGIAKDYSDDEDVEQAAYVDNIDAVSPKRVFKIHYLKKSDGEHEIYEEDVESLNQEQLFQVEHDEKLQELSDKGNGQIQYLATLKAYVESASESDEGETSITEVKQRKNQISIRRFYGEKVKNRMAKERDNFRVGLLKKYIARERAERMKKNFDCSDLVSDTSTSGTGTDLSIKSNTTYSDSEGDKVKKKTVKPIIQNGDRDAKAVSESGSNTTYSDSEGDKGKKKTVKSGSETCPSVGSMWSEGPSNTDMGKTSTETIESTGETKSDTGYKTNGYSTNSKTNERNKRKMIKKPSKMDRAKKKVRSGIRKRKQSVGGLSSGVEAGDEEEESDGSL